MKAVLGLLLLVVPFVWFYVKHYSKKGYVRMQTSMFLDKLYAELQSENITGASRLVIDFLNKASEDMEYMHILNNLPLTPRNKLCFDFIEHVAKQASDQMMEETPERLRSLIER